MPKWKPKSVPLPTCNWSEEEWKAYRHTLKSGYIVSPIGTSTLGEWRIGIAPTARYKEVHKSPTVYNADDICDGLVKVYRYYQEKAK